MNSQTRGLSQWITPLPIPQVDHYLLAMRWIIVLGVAVIVLGLGRNSYFVGSNAEILISGPLAVLPLIMGFNLMVSTFVWLMRPLARGRVTWLLLADGIQAVLVTASTGGSDSLYFLLFLISMVEAGLSFTWPISVAVTSSISMLSVMAVLFNPMQRWDAPAAAITLAKFFAILLMGGVVDLFGEQVRREHTARQMAQSAAAWLATLNTISLRLSESRLEPERILATILDGTHILAQTVFSLVVLLKPPSGRWQIAASTTDRHPVGQIVPQFDWLHSRAGHLSTESGPAQPQPGLVLVGAGTPRPLPDFVAEDGVSQLIGVPLVLPAGPMTGVIAVGRQTDRSLNEGEQLFLRSLAQEAGLALRNARLYTREQEQVERLRRFERLQATFFSAAAHELKTPLTVLKTLIPTLHGLNQLPQPTQLEIIETLEQNLNRLELLVNDMLESARLEAGAIALHRRSLNLTNRVRRVLNRLLPLLERKQLDSTFQAAPHLPAVQADGKRVEQILTNLIDNASKFAPPASAIEVSLSQVNRAVQVTVADAGPGVPPGERKRIFDKFHIAPADKVLAGVGLGLFICRELVRLHGGRIWVEDRPGGGSRFCFTLPITLEDSTDEESESENSDN
jgi:K+-sensing histidine kinase KdpD